MASVWGQVPTPATPNETGGGGTVGYGLRFTVSASGTVDGVWFWRASGLDSSVVQLDVELWNEDTGVQLAVEAVPAAGPNGQWVYQAFDTPVAVTSGVNYIAAYRQNFDFGTQRRGVTADSGLGFPLTVGNITAVKGTREFSSAIPSSDWDEFYWVDPEYTASGGGGVTGTIAVTEAVDTMAASGAHGVSGSLAETETADTMAASGSSVTGTLAETETADTMAASGTHSISGTIAVTEAVDTMSASGTFGGDITGTIAVTESVDTMAASGSSVTGTISATETPDTMAADGTSFAPITGTLAETEAADIMSASGSTTLIITGTIDVTEELDTAYGNDTDYTAVGICNKALTRIGVRYFINSLDELSIEAETCNRFYLGCVEQVLAAHPWGFAKKRADLVVLEEERTGWNETYEIPSDCVTPLSIWSGVRVPNFDMKIPFELVVSDDEDNQILCCDIEDAVLLYIGRITNPARFPPLFVEALAWLLASELAMPVAMRPDLRRQALTMYFRAISLAKANAMNESHDKVPQSVLLTLRGFEEDERC